MKKSILLFLCLTLFILGLSPIIAEAQQNNKKFFDTETATTQFNTIIKQLPNGNRNIGSLTRNLQKLEDLHDQAEACASKSSAELKQIDGVLKSSQLDHSILINQKEYKYLQEEKLFYAKQLSECRFYVYRSTKAVSNYKATINKLTAHKMLTRSTPIWKFNMKSLSSSFKEINYQDIYKATGVNKFNSKKIIFFLVFIGLGVIIAMYLRSLCRLWLKTHLESNLWLSAFITVFSYSLIPLTLLVILIASLDVFFLEIPNGQLLKSISYYAMLFVTIFGLSKYVFYPPYNKKSPLNINRTHGKPIHNRIVLLLTWAILGVIAGKLLNTQSNNSQFVELARTLYVSLSIGFLAWFAWFLFNLSCIKGAYHTITLISKISLALFVFSVLLMEWLGFHYLAIFTIKSTLISTLLLIATAIVLKIIIFSYSHINDNRYKLAKRLRVIFGIKPHKNLKEVLLIKYLIYFLVSYTFIVLVMKIWEMPPIITDSMINSVFNGISFADIKIVPINFIIAVFTFSIIILIGRFIAATISKKQRFHGEQDAQVAIASIIIYITFAIALLFALLIIGVNFTGLAIIAGALSVGIGLGLQNIVNNFVSGIILLLEKPIKPGDRVIVGNTEGFIKKVRLRSTQITTLAKEDVIVPNADLITNQVTNYMFRDRYWRVVCQVGVAYGSPIDLVKNVLLKVASKHPEVIQESPNEPSVLFRNFGDSSLLFGLWCIIQDVNKKFIVISDLNFAIDHAFKANSIIIAFPQRDIHVKENIQIQKN